MGERLGCQCVKGMMARRFGRQNLRTLPMKINFSHITVLLFMLFSMGAAVAGRTAPLVEQSVVFDAQSARTPEQIRSYILRAAEVFNSELTYKIEFDNPGALQLELNKENNHYVSVLFSYDNAGFKANYVSSKNLNYAESNGARVIHPNYMVWIDQLIKAAKTAYSMQLGAKGEVTNPDAVSELTFRSTEGKDTVKFLKADETTACGKFAEVGLVANWPEEEVAAREKEKADWNAKYKTITVLGKRIEPPSLPPRSLHSVVVAAKPVRIRATSSIVVEKGVASTVADTLVDLAFMSALSAQKRAEYSSTANNGSNTEVLSCGPVTFQFTPRGGKKYSIEYSVSHAESRSGKCTQSVFDVTDPNTRIPVPAEEGDICKK